MQNKCPHRGSRLLRAFLLVAFALTAGFAVAGESPRKAAPEAAAATAKKVADKESTSSQDTMMALQIKISEQQAQIDKLTRAVELLTERLNATPADATHTAKLPRDTSVGQISSLTPVIPAAASAPDPGRAVATPSPAAAGAAQVEAFQKKVDSLDKTVDTLSKGIAGFRFSGDLRFRYDGIFRSANSVAGSAQNSRERYRVRFNVNKDVVPQFAFHVQLGTGTANNPATYDSDFSGSNTRGYLWLTEYWGDYHPNKNFSVRAGRMSEVFADDAKFLWDDDVRLNGAQEIAKAKISDKASVEFRAGQYIFTNPNVQKVAAGSVYALAGYPVGGKVRDSSMFHQGAVVHYDSSNWKHVLTVDYQHFINPNQFLIASAAANTPTLVNGFTGITLAGGVGQLGNGTTTAGGLIYTADSYHVGHIGYRVEYDGWKTARQAWPVWLDVQAARNFGGDFQNNAEMATLSIGGVKKAGDVRFLYGYFIKEANSMISQLTDDDIGTGVSVNTRTHYIRVDLGLTKWLQWQNLLYIQNEISGNDPARTFFIASPFRGAATQYRIHSQFAISF